MERIERTLGQRIAEQRRIAGLSQARLAEKMNVSTETISRLETGATMPSVVRLVSLARALGVELHELFRVRPGGDAGSRAIEKLVWQMSRRSVREIEMVIDVAARIFEHADHRPGVRGPAHGGSS